MAGRKARPKPLNSVSTMWCVLSPLTLICSVAASASLSDALAATLQMSVKGDNTHHMVETLFKGFGRALRPALARGAGSEIPSTKGVL